MPNPVIGTHSYAQHANTSAHLAMLTRPVLPEVQARSFSRARSTSPNKFEVGRWSWCVLRTRR